MQRTIPELLDSLASTDIRTAGLVGRELIARTDECTPFIDPLIDCLSLPNYAIANYAWIAIDRLGEKCASRILARLEQTFGDQRLVYLGLISSHIDLSTFLELLPRELRHGELSSRFYAATCLIYRLHSEAGMDAMSKALVRESVELLQTSRTDPTRDEYWASARMALKHCGALASI